MHNTKRVFALARTPVVFLGENPPTAEAYGPHRGVGWVLTDAGAVSTAWLTSAAA